MSYVARAVANGRRSRQGVVLIIVLILVALLSLTAYTFSDLMLAEHAGAQLHGDLAQSQALLASGADSTRAFLMQAPETRQQYGGVYDNPTQFQMRIVADSDFAPMQGMFSIVAPVLDGDGYPGPLRFGLENESAKLNLNGILRFDSPEDAAPLSDGENDAGAANGGQDGPSDGGQDGPGDSGSADDGSGGGRPPPPPSNGGGSGGDGGSGDGGAAGNSADGSADGDIEAEPVTARDALMAMPGMTFEIADAILDWLDEDDEPREYGVEFDYYSSLSPPYQPANGPLVTLSELLKVRGVTPDLLFGRDLNRNGQVDENEQDVQIYAEVDETLGSIDLGWSAYMTTHSREKIVDPLGSPRINLNGDDLQQLYDELSAVIDADLAMFIIAYRQNGPYQDEGEGEDEEAEPEPGEPMGGRAVDLTQSARLEIESVLDLVGARTRVRFEGEEDPVIIASPFPDEPGSLAANLPTFLDYVTVETEEVIPGRINVNQAPRAVLKAVPGMSDNVINSILAQRVPEPDEQNLTRRHPTWLYTDGVVDLQVMRQMMPFLTTGGDVYRARIVGHFAGGGLASRAEVIIDGTRLDVPIVLWKDMAPLGRGYDDQTLGSAMNETPTR